MTKRKGPLCALATKVAWWSRPGASEPAAAHAIVESQPPSTAWPYAHAESTAGVMSGEAAGDCAHPFARWTAKSAHAKRAVVFMAPAVQQPRCHPPRAAFRTDGAREPAT